MGKARSSRVARRAFLGGVLGAATTALLAACGSAPAPTGAPAPTAAARAPEATKPAAAEATKPAAAAKPSADAKPVTIRYGTFWPQYRIDIMATGIKVFQEKSPNVKIDVEGSGAQFADKLSTQIASGTAPDTAICDGVINIQYAEQGQALDMTARLKSDGIDMTKDSWINGYEILCSKVVAMPWVLSPHAWYYNKTMLKQAGAKDPWDDFKGEWTWADMREMLLKVQALPPKDGKVKIYGPRLGLNQI